jgi:hypothetical protein
MTRYITVFEGDNGREYLQRTFTPRDMLQCIEGIPSMRDFDRNGQHVVLRNLDANDIIKLKLPAHVPAMDDFRPPPSIAGIPVDRQQRVNWNPNTRIIAFKAEKQANGNEWITLPIAVPMWSSVCTATNTPTGNLIDFKTGIVTGFAEAMDSQMRNTTFYINYDVDHDERLQTHVLNNRPIESTAEFYVYLSDKADIGQAVTRALSLVRCKCNHLPDTLSITNLAAMSPADQRNYTLQCEAVNAFATLTVACFLQQQQLSSRSWKAYSWSKEVTKMIGVSVTFFQRVNWANGSFTRRRKRNFDWD